MAAGPHHIDPTAYLEELLTQASPDLMRQMLGDFINQILSAQADTVCGADYGTTSDNRVNQRNGYRHRLLDTRVGTVDVAIPKLRHGSFFPDWLRCVAVWPVFRGGVGGVFHGSCARVRGGVVRP